jgi:hypothetical protein
MNSQAFPRAGTRIGSSSQSIVTQATYDGADNVKAVTLPPEVLPPASLSASKRGRQPAALAGLAHPL